MLVSDFINTSFIESIYQQQQKNNFSKTFILQSALVRGISFCSGHQ